MTISVFDNYKVRHVYSYTYSQPYEEFCRGKGAEEFYIDGFAFLKNLIIDTIKDREFIAIHFDKNYVYVEYFDPMTGHSADHEYFLTPINKRNGKSIWLEKGFYVFDEHNFDKCPFFEDDDYTCLANCGVCKLGMAFADKDFECHLEVSTNGCTTVKQFSKK